MGARGGLDPAIRFRSGLHHAAQRIRSINRTCTSRRISPCPLSPYRHIALSPVSDHSGLSCMGLWHFSKPLCLFASSPTPPLAHPISTSTRPDPIPLSTSTSCPENPLHVVPTPRICFECCMQPIPNPTWPGQSTGLAVLTFLTGLKPHTKHVYLPLAWLPNGMWREDCAGRYVRVVTRALWGHARRGRSTRSTCSIHHRPSLLSSPLKEAGGPSRRDGMQWCIPKDTPSLSLTKGAYGWARRPVDRASSWGSSAPPWRLDGTQCVLTSRLCVAHLVLPIFTYSFTWIKSRIPSVPSSHLFSHVGSTSSSWSCCRRGHRRGTCPEHDRLHRILHPRHFAATLLLALRRMRVGMDRSVLHPGGRV